MSRIPKKQIYLEEKQKKNDEIEKLYEDSETRVIRINKRIIIEEKSKKDIELTEESKHPSKMITVVDEDIEIIKEIKPKRINETDIKIEKHQEDITIVEDLKYNPMYRCHSLFRNPMYNDKDIQD